MTKPPLQLILCNGAKRSTPGEPSDTTHLEYRGAVPDKRNVAIGLPSFVRSVGTVPDRVLDLIELASYVYCADRQVSRGTVSSVEYHAWSRRFLFRMKVRDVAFWGQQNVQRSLRELLEFLTGDEEFRFEFEGGHTTPAVSLFDTKEFEATPSPTEIILFSGGLDSLAGTVKNLLDASETVCLVSHRSRQPSIARTQDQLVRALSERFAGRVNHYKFHCHLIGGRAKEETQRARFFLYASIAFALGVAFGRDRIVAYENGITSLNFSRRQDALLGRTSRTTHPRTIAGLCALFSLVRGKPFEVATPFLWLTKADVVRVLKETDALSLLSSTVSCTKTFVLGEGKTHCGCCVQCFDRLFAVYSQEVENADNPSLYAVHLAADALDGASKTVFVDYVRQAMTNGGMGLDTFYVHLANELSQVVQHIGQPDESVAVEMVWDLFKRHRAGVVAALKHVLSVHDDPTRPVVSESALALIHARAYQKEPVEGIVEYLSDRLRASIPLAFHHEKPKRENTLNDHIQSVLAADRVKLEREHPAIRYAIAKAIPDHKVSDTELVIEGKYVRDGRSPGEITGEIAEDITKFAPAGHILFVVYDPHMRIADRATFKGGIEQGQDCTVLVVP
jgi:7-cyano-7-deazaguanine synthase in queuosine biosynthesis